jgi:septum formation protein
MDTANRDEAADAPVILASSSPRRRELLHQAGGDFRVLVSGCDEDVVAGESARDMVTRLALVKASAIAARHPDAFVVGADTTVWIDGEALGKPTSELDAERMLEAIQGRTHEVWGGVALLHRGKGIERVWSHMTRVTMSPIERATISWYVKTGEPMDKAGGYAIQGIGLQFVREIQGSYSNVVGLDVATLVEVLCEYGAFRRRS